MALGWVIVGGLGLATIDAVPDACRLPAARPLRDAEDPRGSAPEAGTRRSRLYRRGTGGIGLEKSCRPEVRYFSSRPSIDQRAARKFSTAATTTPPIFAGHTPAMPAKQRDRQCGDAERNQYPKRNETQEGPDAAGWSGLRSNDQKPFATKEKTTAIDQEMMLAGSGGTCSLSNRKKPARSIAVFHQPDHGKAHDLAAGRTPG